MYNISSAENVQRLRNCLRGKDKDVVSALLHTATTPEPIMKTFEQCFGRLEVIIDQAMDDLRRMPKQSASATDLNNFAVRLQNIVGVMKTFDQRGYLYNPMSHYADENAGTADPEIVTLSQFLMREADRALRYIYAPSTATTTKQEGGARPKDTTNKKKSYSGLQHDHSTRKRSPMSQLQRSTPLTSVP
jgi:hypothetical protein